MLRVGFSSAQFSAWSDGHRVMLGQGDGQDGKALGMTDHARALTEIIAAVRSHPPCQRVTGVEHGIAYGGMNFPGSADLTGEACAKICWLMPFAPLHRLRMCWSRFRGATTGLL